MTAHSDQHGRKSVKRRSERTALARCIATMIAMLFFAALFAPRTSVAIGACSNVKMEILQELTIERVAFDAKMVITNNVPDQGLSSIRVDVSIKDNDGNVQDNLFFVRVSSLQNIAAVDGTGTVQAATAGEIHWLIIPSPGAGGTVPTGTVYWVGATLTYTVSGVQQTVTVNPARIIVKPEAQLILDYFTPFDVMGDNPFTPQVEAPVPFPLAVRVLNAGSGPATNLKIDSAQPKIVENKQGLLVDFKLLGSSVNDSAVVPSLSVSIGTLDSKKIATASWDMIATLSGRIKEFGATFSHSSDLGGELTSLIKETNTHYLVHRVKVNLPGRDNRLDFLAFSAAAADLTTNPDHLPESIYESEIPNNTGKTEDARTNVAVMQVTASPSRPTPSSPEVLMSLQTGTTGWVYARFSDPAQGMLTLLDVVRTDGVHLDPNNFWVQEGLDTDYKQIFTLSILDYRADASAPGTYKLVFTQPAEDTIPPSTRLIFDGPATGADPLYSITPTTRIVLLATDNDGGSGVDQMFRKVTGQDTDFIAALPFNLDTPGTYTLEYYSVDRAGNAEATKTATIVVDDNAPTVLTFQAAPSTLSPYAPRGIAAARTTNFAVKATDDQGTLQATIDIAKGEAYSPTSVVRTLKTSLTKDVEAALAWDAKDSVGSLVPTGMYTARLSVTDGLDSSPTTSHTATATIPITVADWFTGQPLDPNVAGAQQHPRISGSRVVWQDIRSGSWQIYTKDASTGTVLAVTTNPSDHQYPAVDGTIIVWQDNRNGNWDIFGYNLTSGQEFVICNDAGSQERPVIAGNWVAWQDDRNGNWDIYAYNVTTKEQIRITDHVRDQLHPAMAGTTLTWEDYRHGLGEIYSYDLTGGTETRYTVDIYNQTLPAVSAGSLVWTDQRNSQRDIYFSPSQNNELRVTYGAGDHSQATMLDTVLVYTDYEAGIDDPNLAFYDTRSGLGALLTGNPARQEEPALGSGVLVWQDDRDGISQIYWSPFQVEAVPIAVEIKPGFNLIAVGDKLAKAYPTTSSLIAANASGIVIEKIVGYGSQNGTYLDTAAGADIALQKGIAIGVYAAGSGSLDVADSGEAGLYTLLPGTNYIGMLTVPNGYTAYTLLESIGLDNIQSVRRFNNQTGAWESASVRDQSGALSAAGVNFVLHQGDGVIITMKQRLDGWKP